MPDAATALVYLRLTSARNLAVARVTRLKQPKYLLGAIGGVAYLYLVFYRPTVRHAMTGARPITSDPDMVAALVSIAALALLIVFALCWIVPRERASLTFSEAEIAFLFPAPVRRTTLVHYRLIALHISILLTAAIFATLSMRWSLQPGGVLIRVLGWWIVWVTIDLHVVGSGFTLTRLTDAGLSRRGGAQALASAIIALTLATLIALSWHAWPALTAEDRAGGPALAHYAGRVLAVPPLSWILWPNRMLARLFFAADGRSFAAVVGPALLVYAAHYVWVLRVQTTFEEASVLKAEKRAARMAAIQHGRSPLRRAITTARRPRFTLGPTGPAPIAFLWKNLLSTADFVRPRTAIGLAAILIAGAAWLNRPEYDDPRALVGFMAAIGGAYLLVFGPVAARQDLRSDLRNIDILRTYPLRGWQIVLGEILTPIAIICAGSWLLLLGAALTITHPDLPQVSTLVRLGAAAGLGLLGVPIVAIEVLVLNALAVLFPAWSPSRASRTERGIEVMGQHLLLFAAVVVVIAAALTPAAALGVMVYWIAHWLVSTPIAIGAAAVAAWSVLVVEVGVGVWFVGARFERLDLSAEFLA